MGIDDPESFWFPVYAERFGLYAWDMARIRIDHMDSMIQYLKDNPRVTL